MYKLIVTLENKEDAAAVKDALKDAAEEGLIEGAFDVQVEEDED
jgi:hypothetical protein